MAARTTICEWRHLLETHGPTLLSTIVFNEMPEDHERQEDGTIADVTIILPWLATRNENK